MPTGTAAPPAPAFNNVQTVRRHAGRRATTLWASAARPPQPASNNNSSSTRRTRLRRTDSKSSSSSSGSNGGPRAPQLSAESLLSFERRGFLITHGLLAPQQLAPVRECIQQVVEHERLQSLKHRIRVLCPPEAAASLDAITTPRQALDLLAQQSQQELGFLQFFNLARSHPTIAALVRDPRLTRTATQLLGAKKLRLYQDCVFLKEPGWAETNWHSDLRMAPLETNSFVTAWVPLRPVQGGEADSGLVFAAGSHRDFALPFWHDLAGRDLSDRGYPLADTGPMAVGDVSWHHGWLLHASAPQPPHTPPRLALAISFFADGARVLARKSDPSVRGEMLHDEDAESYSSWLRELRDGGLARHPLLPLVC